jgi:hypothetical protein
MNPVGQLQAVLVGDPRDRVRERYLPDRRTARWSALLATLTQPAARAARRAAG